MAFCRSKSIYIFSKPRIRIEIEVKMQKVTNIGVKRLLFLMNTLSVNSSFLIKTEL